MKIVVSKMASLRGVKNLALFEKALNAAAVSTGLDLSAPGEIHIFFVTVPRMIALNALHLHHQGDTDVITYDLRDEEEFDLPEEAGERVLAEIFVCPEVARRQAPQFSETPSRELFRYAAHGLLHLAGEDDLTPEALASMRKAEERVLNYAENAGFSLEKFL